MLIMYKNLIVQVAITQNNVGSTIEIVCIKAYQSDIKLEIRRNGGHSYQINCTGQNSTHKLEPSCEFGNAGIYWVSSNTSPEVECLLLETHSCERHEFNVHILGRSSTINGN